MRIVRTGRGFRVILHAEQWEIAMTHTFQCIVVQVHVREFYLAGRKRIGIHGKVVIVCGDLDFSASQLLYRMVAAMVPEFQLVSFPAESQANQLMAKTDSKDGDAASQT